MLRNMLSKRLNKNNLKISGLFLATLFLFSMSVFALSAAIYYNSRAEAVTTTNLRSRIDLKRLRITYTDVINAPSLNENPAFKRVTLMTLAGGDQILSMVTNTPVAFTLPGVENTSIQSILPEIDGQVVSEHDVIAPPPVSQAEFRNEKGYDSEYLFFSETRPTNIVVTFASDGVTSLDGLSAGTIDFYVTVIN